MKVLIIDDLELARDILKSELAKIGIQHIDEADCAESGKLKIQSAFKEKEMYDFIFCDLNLPDAEGTEVLSFYSNYFKSKQTRFLIISTECRKNHIVRALKEGADGYLMKPLSPLNLENKISRNFISEKSIELISALKMEA